MFAMCCAILQFAARPFLNDTLDVLDCLSMISVSLYLSCGLTFQQKDLTDPQNPHHGTYLLLPKLAQSVAGFNCVIAVLTFYLDFRSSSKANSIKGALTDGVTAAIKTIAMRLRSDGESARSLTHTEAVLLDSVLVSSLTGNADMALATEFAEVSEKAGPDVWTNELPEILLSTSSRSAQRLGHAGQAMRSALLMGHAQKGNHAPAGLLGQQGAGRPSPGGGGRPSPGGGAGGGRPSPGGAGGGGRGAVGDGSNDRKVFVGGLPFDADEGRVRGLFEGKGSIERVTMLNDPVTQMFKGVAFVTLSDAGEANKACEALNGFAHAGRKLRVNMAASRRQ